jgi:hypothetical protein
MHRAGNTRNRLVPFLLSIGLLAGSLGGGCATRTVYVRDAPPPPKEEVRPAPRANYVWVEGHWKWTRRGYVWAPGHWERARKGEWVPGHWDQTARGYVWVPGHWR